MLTPRTTRSPCSPYTTLFRSVVHLQRRQGKRGAIQVLVPDRRDAAVGGNGALVELLVERARVELEFGARAEFTLNAGSFRSEEHTSELQSHHELVCRLLLEKK